MLYHAIKRLEKEYSFFNRYFLSYEFVLKWLEHLGYSAIPDKEIKTVIILKNKESNKRKGIILYNPHLHPDNLDYADVLFSDKT